MRKKYYYMQDYQNNVQKCTAKEAKPKKKVLVLETGILATPGGPQL